MKKTLFHFVAILLGAGALLTSCFGSIDDDWTPVDPPKMLKQQWMTTDSRAGSHALNFFDLGTFDGCICAFWFESQEAFDEYRSTAVISMSPEVIYKYTCFKKGSQYSIVFVNEFNVDIVYYVSDLKKNTMNLELSDGVVLKMTRVDPPVKVERE